MNLETIALADICQGERKRPVDQGKVAEIARSIERDGLYQAIGVIPCQCGKKAGNEHYNLIFGAHRVAAYQLLQRDTIEASILDIGLDEESYLLIELQENSARNDLTGAQRKAYAAEIGRLLSRIAENSRLLIENDEWFKEIIKTSGIAQPTLYAWWKQFCQETGLDLTPRQALQIHQEQFFSWLEAQQREAEAEKAQKAAEAAERHRQEALAEAREYLGDLIKDYGQEMIWQEVVKEIMGAWIEAHLSEEVV